MPKVAIKIEDASSLPEIVSAVRRLTGMSVADIRDRIREGRAILEYPLFYNDHDEKARRLRSLVSQIPPLGARLRIYELEEDQSLGGSLDDSAYEITPETLMNVLDDHDRAVERRDEVDANE
jgi:hypothetical protein